MADDDDSVPQGRFTRLRKMAGMATRIGADLAADRLKRFVGKGGGAESIAARRVLETLGGLKGAAMKAGQIASMFASQLPPEARSSIDRLFSKAPTLSW